MTENNREKKFEITHNYTDEEIFAALSQLPEFNRRVLLNTYVFNIISTVVRCDDGFANMLKCMNNNIAEAVETIRANQLIIETMTELRDILLENSKKND